MSLKLHTMNIGGNLHEAATAINKWGLAEYVIHLDYSGGITVAVFRMPANKVYEIRTNSPSYAADPHHDDYHGPADPYSAFYTGGSERANPEPSSAPAQSASSANAPDQAKTNAASQVLADALNQTHAPVAEHSTVAPSSGNSTGEAPSSGIATTASPSEPAKEPAPIPPKPTRKRANAEKAAAEADAAQAVTERPEMSPETQAAMDNLPAWAR